MTNVADFGKYGVWRSVGSLDGEFAAAVERLGYRTLWVGGSPAADLAIVDELLGATENLIVATGIVNIWKDEAAEAAASFHRIDSSYPGRFVLGIGSGHPEATKQRVRPLAAMRAYLDVLDAEGVRADQRLLAALGPRTLELARDRSLGAHPYLTVPAHTAAARSVLGAALLAPEQKVALAASAAEQREIARAFLPRYLQLSNYVGALLEYGFDESDVADGGSDRLIDALAAGPTEDVAAAAIRAHIDAGADHVAVQALGEDPLGSLERVASSLAP